MGNLFCAPLISDQVAWGGNNIGLPPVGMILADNDLQTGSSDFRSDHLSETFCGDAFLDHGEFPQNGNDRVRSGQGSLKVPSKYMVYREDVCFCLRLRTKNLLKVSMIFKRNRRAIATSVTANTAPTPKGQNDKDSFNWSALA
jgi:hypothetical protein